MDPISDNTVGIIAIISIFVLFPIAVSVARLIWRRSAGAPTPRPLDGDTTRRLMEMQQSIDAMALEIERISEGQRFVTRLLSERPPGAIPAGAASAPATARVSKGRSQE